MKQVWQATDETIFEKEIDCERYEDKVSYELTLEKTIQSLVSISSSDSFIDLLKELVELGHASKLINFIKSIGEQDADN